MVEVLLNDLGQETRCLDTYGVRQRFDSGCDGGEVQDDRMLERKSTSRGSGRSSSQQHHGKHF